jgi:hypothetical protein
MSDKPNEQLQEIIKEAEEGTGVAIVKDRSISPAQLIIEAVQKTGNVTDLKELLAIQKDWEANEARKSFAKSFAVVQSNIEAVVKTRTNSQTHSKYADLGDIIESAKPVYTKEGFSIICYEGDCPKENFMRVFADVLHCAGHKETYHLDLPMDGMGFKGNANMTAIHGKASTSQYARRYLICMILNIPLADNDGNTQTMEHITPVQLKMLDDLIEVKGLDKASLLTYLEAESLEVLPVNQYSKALTAINAAKSVKK